jgi:hypothetical protein
LIESTEKIDNEIEKQINEKKKKKKGGAMKWMM